MICRKQILFATILTAASLLAFAGDKPVQIAAVEFNGYSNPNVVSIRADGPIVFEKQENMQDKQIVLEMKGARVSTAVARPVDTSSFNSNVLLITPYQVEGAADTVRVVVQLRDAAAGEASMEGNTLKLSIPSPSTGASAEKSRVPSEDPPVESGESKSAGDADPQLVQFVSNRDTKKFTGKPITLQAREMDVGDVFDLIAQASGFNIILGEDVKGKLTLSLGNVPWDQALDVVLQTLGLGAERNGNILRVATLNNLTTEKMMQLSAAEAAKAAAPKITRIFPVSYANLSDLEKTIRSLQEGATSFSRPSSTASGSGGSVSVPSGSGTIVADARTNSLIIRDIPENIEKIQKLLEILDTQTPQIMIEGKVVEASEQFSENIGGQLGLSGSGTGQFIASFVGANPVDPLIGTPGVFADGAAIASTTAGAGGLGISFIPGVKRLNAFLNMGERESKLKLIASPKTVVLNKQKASIVQSTPVAITSTTIADGATTSSTQVIQANLSLEVEPTVTNDGSVLLKLVLTRDIPYNASGASQANSVANRKIDTQVVVESGTTLVLGGFYTMSNNKFSSGFPFLRKIPLLGALFGSSGDQTERSELFFFITPQIINPKKAGFGT